jgi:hypothetical protein
MGQQQTRELGQKVVDHFTTQPHDPWKNAESLEDVAPGLQIVRVLLRMRRYEEALATYRGDLSNALIYNLDARNEAQMLLKPYFPDGWNGGIVELSLNDRSYVLNVAALSLSEINPGQAWKLLEQKLYLNMRNADAGALATGLQLLANISWSTNRLGEVARLLSLALELAQAMGNNDETFVAKSYLFALAVETGDYVESNRLWPELNARDGDWQRTSYRPGDLERSHAIYLFYRDQLTEETLTQAQRLAKAARNRVAIKALHSLRGEWHLARGEPMLAVDNLAEAVRMAREVGRDATTSDALLAFARFRAGERFDAGVEAVRLGTIEDRAALAVAELWRALGERDRAVEQALRAHHWAVADGEPYVHRYYLDRVRALLGDLGAELPEVPDYGPARATSYLWEKDVRDFIGGLRIVREPTAIVREPTTRAKRKNSTSWWNRGESKY